MASLLEELFHDVARRAGEIEEELGKCRDNIPAHGEPRDDGSPQPTKEGNGRNCGPRAKFGIRWPPNHRRNPRWLPPRQSQSHHDSATEIRFFLDQLTPTRFLVHGDRPPISSVDSSAAEASQNVGTRRFCENEPFRSCQPS